MDRLKRYWPWVLIVAAPHVLLYPLWTDPVCVGEDDVLYYSPLRVAVSADLRQGRWPLVNPLEGTGAPLMGDPQASVLHPTTWLLATLDVQTAYSISIFAAFTLAGAGAYVYLLRVRLARAAAATGAMAFMFCGFLVGHRVHLSMLLTGAMLPWLLWAIEDLSERPLPAVLKLAPVVALTLAAGHWATAVQMGAVCILYALLRVRPFWRRAPVGIGAALLGVVLVAPQIFVTAETLLQSTRTSIGYASAGENSFFPLSGVLAVLPMIFGNRTPNALYDQPWWGPWHQCEMLGYVGLATLVLAAAAVRRLVRRRGPASLAWPQSGRLVRAWTVLAEVAGVWMLGLYLPTYRLVTMLPVLGSVRCPARLLLAMDLALAVLAAVCVDLLIRQRGEAADLLGRTVKRYVTFGLPSVVLGAWALVAALGWLVKTHWPDKPWEMGFIVGWADDALSAVRVGNPAVLVPLAMTVATLAAVRWWLRRPRTHRIAAVLAVLMLDLLLVARFVDIPPDGAPRQRPWTSPAANIIKDYAGSTDGYRVFSLRSTYAQRPAELLAPKTAQTMGFTTLAGYGPLQPPGPAQLFGFDSAGLTNNWEHLLRDNYLLSAYNVRFILAADEKFQRVLSDVRTPSETPPPPEGPDLLGPWQTDRAAIKDGQITLHAPWSWPLSKVSQSVRVQPGAIYRLALEAQTPDGPAGAIFLSVSETPGKPPHTMTIIPERLGRNWRHFEMAFRTRGDSAATATITLSSLSEKPIALQQVSLRLSRWARPANRSENPLPPGTPVYAAVGIAEPLIGDQRPVIIYENLLCAGEGRLTDRPPDPSVFEALRRHHDRTIAPGPVRLMPRLAVEAPLADPTKLLWQLTLPGALLYVLLCVPAWYRRRTSPRKRE